MEKLILETLNDLFDPSISGVTYAELGDIAAISTGCQYAQFEWPREDLESCTVVKGIDGDGILTTEEVYMRVTSRDQRKFTLSTGDILFKHNAGHTQLGVSARVDFDHAVLHTRYLRIKPGTELDSRFLQLSLDMVKREGWWRGIATKKGNLSYLVMDDLKRIQVPWLSIDEQKRIAAQYFARPMCA